jgi:glycosyltransferase involved in cell wall biosynthesis
MLQAESGMGASQKRLMLVVATYYPDSYGGAERQAKILAEAFARQGLRTHIIAPTVLPAAERVEQTSFGAVERIRVKHFPNYGGHRFASTLAWTWRFLREYYRRDADVAAFYVFHARLHALPALIAAWFSKKPLLIKLGGGGEASDFIALKSKRFFYGEWVLRALLKRADGFVANSSDIVEDLRSYGIPDKRIFAFPNGVEIPPLERLEAAAKVRRGRRFVFTGRMVSDKSIDVLFEAVRNAKVRQVEMELTLLGEGPERTRLSPCIDDAGLTGMLHMPGSTNDVYEKLFASDFFVSASKREGQSNALLEAMSAGCIPIVYGASGAADIVEDGTTGLLVDSSDATAFAKAFERACAMSEDQRLRMSRAAYDATVQRAGVDIVAAKSMRVLDLLARRRQAIA